MCIAKDHPRLSLRRQCRLLSLSRSVLYYTPVGESAENLALSIASSWRRPGTGRARWRAGCVVRVMRRGGTGCAG
jgi:hypothetical protein